MSSVVSLSDVRTLRKRRLRDNKWQETMANVRETLKVLKDAKEEARLAILSVGLMKADGHRLTAQDRRVMKELRELTP